MLVDTTVGPKPTGDGGAVLGSRADRTGASVVTDAHARYFEAAVRGNVFTAASTAGQTTSAGLATTYTGGVCISNPVNSGKNLAILKVSGLILVITAAVTAFGLIVGYATTGVTAHTTPLVPFSTVIGASALPVAKADQAATLVGSPAWLMQLGVTASATGFLAANADLEGSIVIPPGGYIATGTNIASPASAFMGSISWEEISI